MARAYPIVLIAMISAGAVLVGGCFTPPPPKESYSWSIKAPKVVNPRTNLVFSVHTVNREGQEEEGVYFYWAVDWVNLKGSTYTGQSGEEQSIRVKGRLGNALIRVYAKDVNGNIIQLCKQSVEVQ